ncbi:hypothetical protein, partial [Actinomadura geliboluensis]
ELDGAEEKALAGPEVRDTLDRLLFPGPAKDYMLRLRGRGVAEPSLDAWARAAAGRWLAGRQLEARLSRSPELRAALRDLLAEGGG